MIDRTPFDKITVKCCWCSWPLGWGIIFISIAVNHPEQWWHGEHLKDAIVNGVCHRSVYVRISSKTAGSGLSLLSSSSWQRLAWSAAQIPQPHCHCPRTCQDGSLSIVKNHRLARHVANDLMVPFVVLTLHRGLTLHQWTVEALNVPGTWQVTYMLLSLHQWTVDAPNAPGTWKVTVVA